jgi:hypothetical protein
MKSLLFNEGELNEIEVCTFFKKKASVCIDNEVIYLKKKRLKLTYSKLLHSQIFKMTISFEMAESTELKNSIQKFM